MKSLGFDLLEYGHGLPPSSAALSTRRRTAAWRSAWQAVADPLRLSEFHDGREWWRLAYLEGRTPVGVTNSDDSYFLLCDQVGTPVALATHDGHIVQTMQYDSFGNPFRGLQGPVRLPLGFAGGLFDGDTEPPQL